MPQKETNCTSGGSAGGAQWSMAGGRDQKTVCQAVAKELNVTLIITENRLNNCGLLCRTVRFATLLGSQNSEVGAAENMFLTEYLQGVIAAGMEDPAARDQKWKEHIAIHEKFAQKRCLAGWTGQPWIDETTGAWRTFLHACRFWNARFVSRCAVPCSLLDSCVIPVPRPDWIVGESL